MGVKSVDVSDDSGATWHTLPGGSGEWNDEGDQINDTIFGQSFKSTQPGLIRWTANANALYKGFAGYAAVVKKTGIATAMTGEAMSLVSGKTYQVTSAAKRLIDWTRAYTVYDNASPVAAANIEEVNFLFGRVTFISGYTPAGSITLDGYYLPLAEVARANSFTLTQTADSIDKSDYERSHANNGYRVFDQGLKTVSLELGGFYDQTSGFYALLESREDFVIEINPDGSGLSVARGIFKMVNRAQSGDVGALEEETRRFELSIPSDVPVVFNWLHDDSTTLHESIQIMLEAWLAGTKPWIRYLPDGTDNQGFYGSCVITDLTLKNSLDGMNDFTVNVMGADAPIRGVVSN